MIKSLHYPLHLKPETTQVRRGLLALVLLLMGPASTLLLAQGSKDNVFEPSELSLTYDFDACRSFSNDNSAYEYDEFTSEQVNSCAAIQSGHLYRHSGKHSCTDDALGNPGDAACFQSSLDSNFSPDHTLAIRFDVILQGLSDRSSRLDGISFQQFAPHNYIWSAIGYPDSTGPNNYPTKYGIRVLKDGVEIYNDPDRATAQYWKTETFDFTSNDHFQVSAGQTSTFTFELISYAPVGNGATVSAWDLDNLKIFSACEVACNLTVDAGEDQTICEDEEITLTASAVNGNDCENIISSYKISDSSTEGKSCFPTWGSGVIFQRAAGCQGSHHIWKAGNDLMLQEFSNQTAKITGTVIDQNGVIGTVDITLGDKADNGTTWQANCYQVGIDPDPRTFYKSFSGSITVNGQPLTVELKASEQHYILANGAGFEQGQFGLGAWTGGTFGGCTEWFGTLEPMQIDSDEKNLTYLWSTGETTPSITVNQSGSYTVTVTDCKNCMATDTVQVTIDAVTAEAGDDKNICKGDTTTLSVTGEGTYLWSTGETTQSIEVAPEVDTTYSVTVTNGNCEATDTVKVSVGMVTAEVCDDWVICEGDTATLSVSGEGNYLWSTGETTETIEVSPEVTTTYSVTVTNGSCEITEEVLVTVENKIVIGDYVWLDKNQNGLQDDGSTGVNNITVELYQCNGDRADMTTTANDNDGEAGYYQFEVCPNSGDYYIVFGAEPERFEFTSALAGDSSSDSNADADGKTSCFNISEENDLSIDAGLQLKEICDITVDAGKSRPICSNSSQIVELTATIQDESDACEGGCVYPILEQERCYGPTGTFEIWLMSTGRTSAKFSASEQRFERLANGDARYTAEATNGVDNINIDVTFSGYTTTPTLGSPKLNDCQDYDTSDWEYWTKWNGTITSKNHGVFTLSMLGAPFQMGVGADVVRSGFGASGWFTADGGDGYYTTGDINITLAECQENGVEYKWTTQDGNIVSDPYKKTISVDQPGTYVFEAMNCIDCFASDKIVVKEVDCNKTPVKYNSTKISKVYPVPVTSGSTLTLEFGTTTPSSTGKQSFGPQLEEDVKVVVYDINGRMISVPRSFKMIDGKATIHLDINDIPSGKYIVKAQGNYWAESKHFLVK